MALNNSRFADDLVLQACADGTHLMEPPEKGLAVRRVQWALLDLGFDLPMFGADGNFGSETANAVSAEYKNFKRPFLLTRKVSPGW
jgi:peptidoglycan hydrolase-like protein with peptidoglycan-binding domain